MPDKLGFPFCLKGVFNPANLVQPMELVEMATRHLVGKKEIANLDDLLCLRYLLFASRSIPLVVGGTSHRVFWFGFFKRFET